MMGWYVGDHMTGWGWFGMTLSSLLFIALLVLGGMLLVRCTRQSDGPAAPPRSAELDVTPDVMIVVNGTPALVVDAKYRTREGTTPSVAAGDIYEPLAFMRATVTTSAVLLYPRPSDAGPAMPVGSVGVFERVTVGSEQIVALTVECRGISATDGYGQFASRLSSAVQQQIV